VELYEKEIELLKLQQKAKDEELDRLRTENDKMK